ncbi:MgtC/SapB family protein [Marinobacter sp.]|uniref:MgtC/SapB family protein n=1 Tax=Marinobacter sp. TaxID=50741 RepID=UPI0038508959
MSSQFIQNHPHAIGLLVALLLGALIGLERGWEARHQEPGDRIAGIRTHALIGLLGGISGLISETLTTWAFPLMFLGLIGICLVAYRVRTEKFKDFSITGMIGLLLTFCFGAIAVSVSIPLASAAAVITAIILDNKQEIHGLVNRLQSHEMDAALKLLLISVVMLPLLPDRNLGPGGALNPYEIWWLVVLIASVSFVGYFAIRVGGTEKGLLFTSIFAGMTSSTALTLHFARQSRRAPELSPILGSGILLAAGTMFPRILVYCLLISPALLPQLVWPVTVMTLLLYAPALVIWRRNRKNITFEQPQLARNPLELKSALLFGILLTAILFLGEFLRDWLGDAGVLVLAATSGVADVDAITLSLTRMSLTSIDAQTAIIGIVIATSVNNGVKCVIAAAIGTRALGMRIALPIILSLLGGLATAVLIQG